MGFTDGQRQPRPTYRVLKALPAETFRDQQQRASIELFVQDPKRDVRLYDLEQPLLENARTFFPDRTPDRHAEASRAARMPVYEVRDRSGAGWRGAVVRDDVGDPWLTYAAKHDHFHASVAGALSAKVSQDTKVAPLSGRMPTKADYKIRAREERAALEFDWRRGIVNSVIVGIAAALKQDESIDVELEAPPARTETARLTIRFEEHEQPDALSDGAGLATSSSIATMELRCSGPSQRAVDAALQEVLPVLQSDQSGIDAHYDLAGNMSIWLTVSHAKLAQIVAAAELDDPQVGIPDEAITPTHLHYVHRDGLTRAVVQGRSVRSVCGFWFVPTKDDGCGLPICPACEERWPAAQLVVDLIRRRYSVE